MEKIGSKEHIIHPIKPLYDENSKILILGSFPSVKSREQMFFYGHPQNRFWPTLARVFDEEIPTTVEEKKALALRHGVALWDTIASCDITGSSDSSIENVVANDLTPILKTGQIRCIYCNGTTSYNLFEKYISPALDEKGYGSLKNAVCMPSTSPANAAWSPQALKNAWMRIKIGMNRTDGNQTDGDRRGIYALSDYALDHYGKKLYRLSLDGGFTCPNRDGKLDTRGCIFCDGSGSGDFAGGQENSQGEQGNALACREILPISAQLARQKELVRSKLPKQKAVAYIAYFQSFTGTYAPVETLRKKYEEAIEDPEVEVLSIATRPDCLLPEVLALLEEINQKIPVWVELGLQTSDKKTAEYIRRGYDLKVYNTAVANLQKIGIPQIITHVILGLPGESKKQMLKTVQHVAKAGSNGIKLQLLHILRGTDLAKDYEARKFETLTLEQYLEIVEECTDLLPPDLVVHRLTGDGNKKILIAPLWSADKKTVWNAVKKRLNLI